MQLRLIFVLSLTIAVAQCAEHKRSRLEAKKIATRVLESVPLIDGHNDLAANIITRASGQLANIDLSQNLTNHPLWVDCGRCHTDIPRLRAGKLGAQFWSAFSSCATQFKDAAQRVFRAIDTIKRFTQKYSDDFQLATTPQGIWDAFNNGKIASLIGVEGGHTMDNRLAILRQFYDVGARYMTLNHLCNNPWSDGSNVDDPSTGMLPNSNGLSEFGKTVIREMNRLGMMVDLSHTSKATQLDVSEISRAPLFFSHSNAFALCDHHRNVHDDVLELVRDTNGIAMVNFFNTYVTCSDDATIQDVANHINHIVSVAGFDHVGIGSDFDGVRQVPDGLIDVSYYPDLFALLAEDPRWTEENLRKLATENFIRVFTEVERIRDVMAAEGVTPYEDNIPVADIGNNTACYSPQ